MSKLSEKQLRSVIRQVINETTDAPIDPIVLSWTDLQKKYPEAARQHEDGCLDLGTSPEDDWKYTAHDMGTDDEYLIADGLDPDGDSITVYWSEEFQEWE
jgi:hypothetical protein